MSLATLQYAVQTFGSLGSSVHGIGYYMVLAGFAILGAILAGVAALATVRFLRRIGDMSPGQFIVFMAMVGLGLIIIGTLLPA